MKEISMGDTMYELWGVIGKYGRKAGLSMVTLVTVWDVMMTGLRGFMEYSIGYKGIVLIWVGVALIFKGHRIERNK